MKEDFLQYIWANDLYDREHLFTDKGKKITVVKRGQLNKDAGPDFFNARIRVEDVDWVGNIEIHIKNSDWYRHGHHTDPAYNNVILSVVKTNDMPVYNNAGQEIECVELKYADNLYNEYNFMKNSRRQPGCYRNLDAIDDYWFFTMLQSLAIERLERKVSDIRRVLIQTGNNWEECFYRLLCKYWSGNVNSDIFYQLALTLPYKVLLKYIDRPFCLEALLFGVSGLLECAGDDDYVVRLRQEYAYFKQKHRLGRLKPEQWKFMRIRPDAFPTVRLALLAAFIKQFGLVLPRLLEAENVGEIARVLEVQASDYWNTHYVLAKTSVFKEKRVGEGMQKTVLINAIVPFLFVYGREQGNERLVQKALQWLEDIEPEGNYIVESWKKCGFSFDSALQTQALIQLRKEYCDKHLCLHCRVGREVLKNIGKLSFNG